MDENLLKEELELYLSLYQDEYDEGEIEFLRENLIDFYKNDIQVDITSQVLVALNRMKDSENRYKKYFEYLKNKYNLKQNILEVACGKFPALSKYIDEYQRKMNKGTITAYDPTLVTIKYGKINLNKKFFDKTTDISKMSLITAMHPSDVTIPIIEISNENDKDFSILTCGCAHFLDLEAMYYYQNGLLNWHDYLFKVAKNNLSSSRTIDIDYIEGVHTPIISSRKKAKIIK